MKKLPKKIFWICSSLFLLNCVNQEKMTVPLKIGETLLYVEIADEPHERTEGLMHRKEMPFDHGMLFIFHQDEKRNFWMKNTLIPLDIAYISSEGVIKEIHSMKPLDLSPIRSRYSVRYALEMNQGYFHKNGIVTGDRLDLEAFYSAWSSSKDAK